MQSSRPRAAWPASRAARPAAPLWWTTRASPSARALRQNRGVGGRVPATCGAAWLLQTRAPPLLSSPRPTTCSPPRLQGCHVDWAMTCWDSSGGTCVEENVLHLMEREGGRAAGKREAQPMHPSVLTQHLPLTPHRQVLPLPHRADAPGCTRHLRQPHHRRHSLRALHRVHHRVSGQRKQGNGREIVSWLEGVQSMSSMCPLCTALAGPCTSQPASQPLVICSPCRTL